MGLVISQLGNVVQSAVGDADRSEAGRHPEHGAAARIVAGHGAARRGRDHRPRSAPSRTTWPPTPTSRTTSSSRSRSGSPPAPASSHRDQVRTAATDEGVPTETVEALVTELRGRAAAGAQDRLPVRIVHRARRVLRDAGGCRRASSPSWNRAPIRLRPRPKRPPDRRLPAAILRRRSERGLDRVEAGSDVLERCRRSPRRAHRERRLRRMPCLSRIWSMRTAVTAAVMTVRNAIPFSITTVAIRRPAVPSGTTSP